MNGTTRGVSTNSPAGWGIARNGNVLVVVALGEQKSNNESKEADAHAVPEEHEKVIMISLLYTQNSQKSG